MSSHPSFLIDRRMVHILDRTGHDEDDPYGFALCGLTDTFHTAEGYQARLNRGWWRLVPAYRRKEYLHQRYGAPLCQHCFRMYDALVRAGKWSA